MDESCSIFKWLQKKHPKFASVLDENCAAGLFRPGRAGITFLFPTGKAQAELVKQFKTNPLKATHQTRALVVDADLKTGEDWEAHKDDLPNRMRIKVKVKSVSKDKVTFDNGATASPMKGFKPRSDRTNMSVWEYSGPLQPTEGEHAGFTRVNDAKRGGRRRKRGGASAAEVAVLRKRTTDEACVLLAKGEYAQKNPFTRCVVSYLGYMEKHNAEYCHKTLCPMLDNAPEVSFLILFGDALVLQGRNDWLQATGGMCMHPHPSKKYLELLAKAADSSSKLRNTTREVRNQNRARDGPLELRKQMVKAYKENAKNYSPVYEKDAMLKALHDETRYMVGCELPSVVAQKDVEAMRGLLSSALMSQRASGDRCNIVTESVCDKLSREAYYRGSLAFFYSDCFLYAPYVADMSSGVSEQVKQLMSDSAQGGNVTVVPANDVKMSNLQRGDAVLVEPYGFHRVSQGEANHNGINQMVGALDSISASDLSDADRTKLAEAMKRLG